MRNKYATVLAALVVGSVLALPALPQDKRAAGGGSEDSAANEGGCLGISAWCLLPSGVSLRIRALGIISSG